MSSIAEKILQQAIIYHKENKLKEAEAKYEQVIAIKPDYVLAYNNLGSILFKFGRLKEAEEKFKKAIELKPNYLEANLSMGNTLYKLDRLDEAENFYKKTIKLKPDFLPAILSMGQISFTKKKFDLAYKYFELCNTRESRSRALICLYALGRTDEIYERIEKYSELDELNLNVAAFSAFIENKEKKQTANNFCKKPHDFIHFSNLSSHIKNSDTLISEIINELNKQETIWEPFRKSTRKGFQSKFDIFADPKKAISKLKSVIIKEIDLYYSKFKEQNCTLIKKWPSKKNMEAWHVIYKKQGYQDPHIHFTAWLSGVIYLKVVPPLEKNEGAIEFSLNSINYSDINSPKLIHEPKVGDVILFPSTLYHRTIPFSTDTDRIIISFNLMPEGFAPSYN